MKNVGLFKAVLLAMLVVTTSSYSKENNGNWRLLDPEQSVLLTLQHGQVVIELAPQFSPKHVQQFKELVRAGHYNGNKFYRVIDGFVAQGGPEDSSEQDRAVPLLKMESEIVTNADWSYTPVQKNDLFASETGFKDGFALGRNHEQNKAWLLHCPGVIAMARGNEADSASSHFYITNGQAPRYLDRIMTIFGRVVYGMNHVQAITRTQVLEGEEPIKAEIYTPMVSLQIMSDVAKEQRIELEIENTESDSYKAYLASRKNRTAAFFYKKPPAVLDVCQVPVKTRIAVKR
jgi:peptidylprolyl isomerase